MTLMRALVLLLAIMQSSLFAAEGSFVIMNRIFGLSWRMHEVRFTPEKGKFFHLEGEFKRPGWSLVGEKRPIPVLPGGGFTLDKEMKGQALSIDLVAVGPNGEVESETVGFLEGTEPPIGALTVPAPALVPTSASVEPPKPGGTVLKNAWLDFQVGMLAVIQSGVGLSLAPKASWTPRYALSEKSGLRANLGLSLLRRISTGAFLSFDYALLFSQEVAGRFQIEAGGGAETWLNYGGTRALLRANFAWLVGTRFWGFTLDRVALAYSLLPDAGPTQSFFVGAGLVF